MSELYIGLMSGTSVDGIDAVLVDFSQPQPRLIQSYYYKFPADLRQSILALCLPGADEIKRMGDTDILLGNAFADAVQVLIQESQISSRQIRAIGCHGQTIRHYPDRGYTLQIGDPNIIAAKTQITTIADFRRRDMAHGGQGAPLVPAFHQAVFAKEGINRAIVNIGGIANVTLLNGNKKNILGFDTGPGNTLLDAWIEKYFQKSYDEKGAWGSQGNIDNALLEKLLSDPYFHLQPPKSTGREYFNLEWLKQYLKIERLPVDVQATLTALTAHSIVNAITPYFSEGEIVVCGGGVYNTFLMDHLQQKAASSFSVYSTHSLGVDPNWVEGMAFAWLARQTLAQEPGNMMAITGASQPAILGGIYQR